MSGEWCRVRAGGAGQPHRRNPSQIPVGPPAARSAHFSPHDTQSPRASHWPFRNRLLGAQDRDRTVYRVSPWGLPPSRVPPTWTVALGVCPRKSSSAHSQPGGRLWQCKLAPARPGPAGAALTEAVPTLLSAGFHVARVSGDRGPRSHSRLAP